MIKLKIDVKKIAKAHMFEGEKGTYLDLALFTNKDGPDKYGNDGFIVQDVSKEARERGEKGPIIGNWKETERKSDPTKWPDRTRQPAPRATDEPPDDDSDSIPF